MAATYQNLANVYSDVRFVSNKDANTLIDADLLLLANKYFGLIFRSLVDLDQDIYTEISTTNLVSGQKEYVLPTDDATTTYGGGTIKPLRVEVALDGTNWYVAKQVELDTMPFSVIGNSNANINANFSSDQPRFAYYDRSLWIYPIPTQAVTSGLMAFYIKRPNEIAASAIPEMPKDFLSILSEGMLIDIYRKFGKVNESDRARLNFNRMLETMKVSEYAQTKFGLSSSNDISSYK